MSARWPVHPTRVGLSLPTAATSYLTLRSWSGITADPGAFLTPLLWICLLLAASGLLLRGLRLPMVAVVAVQVLLVLVVLNHLWAGSVAPLGWLPSPESLRRDLAVLGEAGRAAQEWSTPVPASVTTFPPLLVGVGALLALVVEVLVGAVRRVPLAGLPLIAALTVPVSLLGGVPLLAFASAAVAFSLLLAADQTLRVGQWGLGHWGGQREQEDQHTDTEVGLPSTLPPAFAVGVAGVVVAIVAPILLPSGLGLLDRIGSGGSGDGAGGPLELSNPMLNLQRDLVQGSDDPLLQVSTNDPSPDYLRLTVLDEFDGDAWRPSERDIPPTNQADERLPSPPGLAATTPKQAYRATMVATEDFQSQWLPTPYPAVDVSVSGDWRYDSDTVDIVGSETTFTQAEVTSLDVDPDPEELVDAPLPPRGIERLGTDLPDDVPDFIERTAEEVTEGATSDFERIVMLQRWFRQDGGFEYTLRTSSGNGLEQLEVFLGDGPGSREGYCEQFATAMALMARSLDIPARVSVGFLEPKQLGPDRWVYSSRDLHAWPEIYFEGAGWTLFDPTPSIRVPQVPEYTSGQLPSEQQSAGPTDLPSDANSSAPRDVRRDDLLTDADGAGTDSGLNPLVPTAGGVVLLLAGLVLLPRTLRSVQRRRRLEGRLPAGTGVAEGAWSEVRATALDLDLDWDDGASLRRQAVALLAPLRRGETTAGAPGTGTSELSEADVRARLESLVFALEQGRYSRWGLSETEAATAVSDGETIVATLLGASSPQARRRATWVPASLWRARRINAGGGVADVATSEREQMRL